MKLLLLLMGGPPLHHYHHTHTGPNGDRHYMCSHPPCGRTVVRHESGVVAVVWPGMSDVEHRWPEEPAVNPGSRLPEVDDDEPVELAPAFDRFLRTL